jgi:hypothetical protein
VLDYDEQEECLGQYGLPAEKNEDLIYFLHMDIPPIFMAGTQKDFLKD